MRGIVAIICLCLLGGSAFAGSTKTSDASADVLIKALHDNLSATYLCRNVAGVDIYLKARSTVEATMLKFSKNADLTQKALAKWEGEFQKNAGYRNPNISVDECKVLLKGRLEKLKAALDSFLQ
ncbi:MULTISPECIES: hypothetical protein [Rhizobium]|jgi:hypothetical protein|uniref:hypothetical protein n=1 Tax=Rhizobium TaxID=379 RepID=UPI00096A33A6|nr:MULTISPECIES: hypothetical protein [Rhizobium]NTG46578.1 hypothetical protein [Rhizobium rhizogenes]